MGASNQRFVPKSRVEILRFKREVRESQLAYARSVGDARKISECEVALAKIAAWERGES